MLIGLDGDDTLWKNEDFFTGLQLELQAFIDELGFGIQLHDDLLEIENRNVAVYGYGKKSFLLSLFEFVGTRIEGAEQRRIMRFLCEKGHWLMQQPAELLPGVADVLEQMRPIGKLVVITKGDVAEQTRKIAEAGIDVLIGHHEIVAQKDAETYRQIIAKHGSGQNIPFVMIGNSLRSDILPVTALGHHAIHVPYHVTWAHEDVAAVDEHYHNARSLADVIPILRSIAAEGRV